MALITCREVAFSYDCTQVVEGLNFSVHTGDYLCIAGENGSGKSTLLKGILGLKQPSGGSITRGEQLGSHEIGYLPQHTPIQKDFPASVHEVVLSGRLNALNGKLPLFSKEDRRITLENMKLLSIDHLKYRCYRELSGGQQQRVLLARALCAAKRLLLLDEPVSGLDPLVTQDLYHLIEKINREKNITVIMVSHDIKSAVKYTSHVLHLKHTQAFFGKTRDYCRSDIGIAFLNC